MKEKVLVARATFPDIIERLAAHFDVERNETDELLAPEALRARLADKAGALLMGLERIDEAAIAAAPRLRAVANCAAGHNNLDLPALTRAGIIATNTPDVSNESVADFAWTLMLAAARRLPQADAFVRAGKWRGFAYDLFLGLDLHGTTLGIIGMGRIGQAIARRAAGFGMKVLYHNRSRLDAAVEHRCNAEYASRQALLAQADHVVLVLPYSAAAHHLIGARELQLMKPTATLTNIARGGIVDDAALAAALHRGTIAAAALDVFEGEPAFDAALLAAPNLVLAPHIGSATTATRRALANLAVDNLIAALGYGPTPHRPACPLNPEVLHAPVARGRRNHAEITMNTNALEAVATAPPAPVTVIDQALALIRNVLGDGGWLAAADDIAPYLTEQRGLYRGATCMVVRPCSVQQVSAVMRICSEAGIAVIPQGGNTGLCGAAVPPAERPNIVMSLARLRSVRSVDPGNFAITVDAGCILADIQRAAAEHDRLFPLSLGAEGSCQIGGNLSTNAGGIQVLRFGNARELTLGIEVVLPDGRILDGLRALRKDNTGYDLKHLFIGAEGTLGIITGATLRLYPKPAEVAAAYVSLPSLQAVIDLLALARRMTGDQLTAFEFMPRFGVDIAARHIPDVRDPLPGDAPWYVLMELSSSMAGANLAQVLEALLAEALEAGMALDAAVPASDAQRQAMWRIREGLVEAQKFEGASIKYDVSVPIMSIPTFVARATAACLAILGSARPLAFGHCGDGNVHFNLAAPPDNDGSFVTLTSRFDEAVFDTVTALRGSISAEHGIGRTKRDALGTYKSAVELDIMRRIKAALDPANLLNPDKVLPAAAAPGGAQGA